MSHTPGPWYSDADSENDSWTVWNRERLPRRSVALDIFNEPDARLIAAAPDLLAAVNLLLDQASTIPLEDRQIAAEAVNKALGTAQG